jgi:hypothetical protein
LKRPTPKKTIRARTQTPFQTEFLACLDAWQRREGKTLSGRAFSALLGRSSNHFNLMVNAAFVPSGDSIHEMVEILQLGQDAEDRLIQAAIATKSRQRGRDSFWLCEAGRMIQKGSADMRSITLFLKENGLTERFEAWKKKHP